MYDVDLEYDINTLEQYLQAGFLYTHVQSIEDPIQQVVIDKLSDFYKVEISLEKASEVISNVIVKIYTYIKKIIKTILDAVIFSIRVATTNFKQLRKDIEFYTKHQSEFSGSMLNGFNAKIVLPEALLDMELMFSAFLKVVNGVDDYSFFDKDKIKKLVSSSFNGINNMFGYTFTEKGTLIPPTNIKQDIYTKNADLIEYYSIDSANRLISKYTTIMQKSNSIFMKQKRKLTDLQKRAARAYISAIKDPKENQQSMDMFRNITVYLNILQHANLFSRNIYIWAYIHNVKVLTKAAKKYIQDKEGEK